MNPKLIAAAVLVLLVLVLLSLGFYIVDEREQVVVTRFQKPVRVIVGYIPDPDDFEKLSTEIKERARRTEDNKGNLELPNLKVTNGAGLYFKIPFIEVAERFPDTILEYDSLPQEINTLDKKKLTVDNFARWRIENPLQFWLAIRSEAMAQDRLDAIIYSVMREELASSDLIEVIRTTNSVPLPEEEDGIFLEESRVENTMRLYLKRGREEIMNTVTERANIQARELYGIRIIDVRIKRAELLPDNLQAVFGRMQAERQRISKAYRSEGQKERDIIEGETDRQVAVITAEAKATAQRTRGDGDAESVRIFAEAFGSDPEFYKFVKSLEVIRESTPAGSELVIGLGSSIYSLIKSE